MRRLLIGLVAGFSLFGALATNATADPPATRYPPKVPVATGTGGAAATVDALASQAAVRVLERGGNAIDAAVAAAAMLGVVEPYSCGIGGGGFMVIYRASDQSVTTIDSRETAPAAFRPDSFLLDPATGAEMPFAEAQTSGLGVGVPGTFRAWEYTLAKYGTMKLARLLVPAKQVAQRGFVVDQTFTDQTNANRHRFRDIAPTRALFLTASGEAPAPGSIFRNPDLARTYARLAAQGSRAFYSGPLAQAIVRTVQNPPVVPGTTRNVRPGVMTVSDLAAYRVVERAPAVVTYRGLQVYGMGPPSSGGSTVGESLNILEGYDLAGTSRVDALHRYIEASALAFADRGRYLGDSDYVFVPLAGLLSDSYAAERRALIGPTAAPKPVEPGDPTDNEGPSTTHLTVSDRWGNVVSYTFTIESTGGSALTVPGYGFLLNNELTDFDFQTGRENSPAGGKRPRSSMSPTIVLSNGRPLFALGSPGGATIITTVLQILLNRIDFGMTLPEAVNAARLSPRNGTTILAEPGFMASPERAALEALGHRFAATSEIGAATAIEFFPNGFVQAVAEPLRRGGGSALVVAPSGSSGTSPGKRTRARAGIR
ncbi:MAG: gamma-glutamyltransferase [Actinomycetota bacterium]|nr:gamma-glutamyltransferase [Actinomycetota bacterium]